MSVSGRMIVGAPDLLVEFASCSLFDIRNPCIYQLAPDGERVAS